MLVVSSLGAQAQDSEEALREQALELFEAEDYQQALPIYSQLLSLNLQSPEYNFRFGACQVFVNSNKEEGLKYLSFAVKDKAAPPLSHYYYGLGLHFNYRFDRAIDEYQKYKAQAGKKEREAKMVDHNIEQCVNGKNLVSRFTDINVMQNQVLPRAEFFRNYDLRELGGKIIVKPDEFMSDEDRKRDARFLMYFQQNSDVIYYASYSDKNATGKDLFVITKLPTGDWSKPERLSDVVNTPFDEDFPFIHPDGSSLYFASKGHNSMGGYDIFKSTRTAQGTFTQPINQEFAINTPWDDFMFITDKAERIAWFASNRVTDSKSVTVYKISMERVPLDLTLIKGSFITETLSKKAKITVEDMVQGKTVGVFESDRQLGGYLLDLQGSGKYKFIIEAEESAVVHTGIVEIPREKGLKQFRQEMKLVNNGGTEQLQIINHFDEPLKDGETLLTAEILKKRASLSVNADEAAFARTTEILDESDQPAEDIAKMDRIGFSTKAIRDTENEIRELDKRAAYLYGKANGAASSGDPDEVAEATLAAEMALEYKKAADEKRASLTRMEAAQDAFKRATGDEKAETAKFNQFLSIAENQKDVDAIEEELTILLDSRIAPLEATYEAQKGAVAELEDDLVEIDKEIAYYKEEIDNTKDEAVKEELKFQISEAEAAKPEKEAQLAKSKMQLAQLESSSKTGRVLLSVWTDLVKESSQKAAATESTVKVSSISVLSQSLKQKAKSNPPLLAMVDPASAAVAPDETRDEGTKNVDLNQEIKEISNETEVTKIEGDYNDYFLEQLSNAGTSADKLNAEMRKAELYDQWADNIDLRVDSLGNEIATTSDPALKTSLVDDRKRLQKESETKRELALESYQSVAVMNDQEAEISAQINNPNPSVTVPDPDANADEVANAESTTESQPSAPAENTTAEEPQSALEILNAKYEAQLTEVKSIEDEAERQQRTASINRQWASDLQTERDKLALATQQTTDESEKAALRQQSAKLEEQQNEKQAIAAQLSRENNQSQETSMASTSDEELEQQLFPLIENYNRPSFEQIETKINSGADTPERNAKTLTLARNWLLAIQNQEVKTEARIANTSSPATKAELQKTLEVLARDKVEVRQKIAALSGAEASVQDLAAPSEVQLKASERFEGYVPVESQSIAEAEAQVALLTEKETALESDISQLETTLAETKKKKEQEAIQTRVDMKRNELAIIQTQSTFYQEAANKLDNVEADLIQFKKGDQLPSERQQAEVETLKQAAELAATEATEQRKGAEGIKNKKERAAALRDVEKYEIEATQKNLKAELSQELVADMQSIEEAAIQQNYIVLPGRATVLPVVKRSLNPTERADVEATAEYREYAAAIGEAEDLAQQARAKEQQEQALRDEAQEALTSAALAASPKERTVLTEKAYGNFEKADRLSEETARIKRRSAFVRNAANGELLQRPEEVYLNVLAAMQSRPAGAGALPIAGGITTPGGAVAVPETGNSANDSETNNGEQAATGENDLANLDDGIEGSENAGTQENNANSEASQNTGNDSGNNPTSAAPTTNNTNPDNGNTNGNQQGENAQNSGEFELTSPTPQAANNPADKLTSTIFEIKPEEAAAASTKPIPMNTTLPSGVVYKIQVGAFRNAIPPETFGNMKPLVGESAGNGLTRYTVGLFKDFSDAEAALARVKALGYRDAFVVSYFNSSRVPVTEAQSVERNEIATPPSYVPSGNRPTNTATASPAVDPNNLQYITQGPLRVEDVNNSSELFYTVQVGVFTRPVTSAEIKNITPLNQENMNNGNYRYSTGKFDSFDAATRARDEVRALGISDAFVVAYRKGQRLAGSQMPTTAGGNTPQASQASTQPRENNTPAAKPVARIKLGTFAGEIPVSQASVILNLSGEGVEKQKNGDGTNSYYFGSFTTQADAEAKLRELKQKGLDQAVVVPAP